MPLGSNVSDNIKELYRNGTKKRSRAQIIAIAESAARKAMGGMHKSMMKSDKEPDKKHKKEHQEGEHE